MLKYKVKADRDAIVEGLAVFTPDEERTFTEQDERQFFNQRGIHLNQNNVPAGVTVTIVVAPDPLDETDAAYIQDGVN
jgi:hypothetical protein